MPARYKYVAEGVVATGARRHSARGGARRDPLAARALTVFAAAARFVEQATRRNGC